MSNLNQPIQVGRASARARHSCLAMAGLLVEGRNPRLPTQQSEEENDLEGNTK